MYVATFHIHLFNPSLKCSVFPNICKTLENHLTSFTMKSVSHSVCCCMYIYLPIEQLLLSIPDGYEQGISPLLKSCRALVTVLSKRIYSNPR